MIVLVECMTSALSICSEDEVPEVEKKKRGRPPKTETSAAPQQKKNNIVLGLYPKQREFIESKALYTAYGGARGGGKTHALRVGAFYGALKYEGIKILIIRRTYNELRDNHIEPMVKMVPQQLATYNGSIYLMRFENGSTIKFGHYNGDASELEYQGQEYDWIFMDEATQFCVHPDTEVLLEGRGWTRIDETFRGDRVMSLNPDGTQEYKTIEQMFCFQNSQPMYECNQRNGAAFCVTHGHKIPVKDRYHGGWRFKEVQDIKNDDVARIGVPKRKQSVDWFADLPHHFKGHNEAKRIPMNDWLEFLGWYLSEGCCFARGDTGNTPRVSIRQTKEAPTLKALMDRLPYRYSYRNEGQYIIYSGQLYDVLHPIGNTYEKRVPDYVFKLDVEQIKIFLKAFELGDGHYDKNGAISFGLANEGLIDDLQRLYSIVGRISTKGYAIARGEYFVYRLCVSSSPRNYSNLKHCIHEVPYEGPVWCPVVADNHNFLIRYNGRVSYTGNTEHQFRVLGGCLRGVNDIPKHFYLTCNPGGIGHKWVKRLFIEQKFKTNCANPEENENPKDYKFIPALLEDNKLLMQSSPQYAQMLANLPEKMRAAHRYGDWNALSGAYFDEFSEARHVIEPFPIPKEWRRYRAFDYGVRDMFACLWVAVDFQGRCYVYREFLMGEDLDVEGSHGLIVPDAAQAMIDNTLPNEHIDTTFAPPDMWLTQSISGKCAAEEFMVNGIGIVKSSNNRVQGHMLVKQMLADMPEDNKPAEEWRPQLLFFKTCPHIIDDISAIQADDKNPNDCAKQPHDITHDVDALRYFCISRTMPSIIEEEHPKFYEDDDGNEVADYDTYLAGGEISESYMKY